MHAGVTGTGRGRGKVSGDKGNETERVSTLSRAFSALLGKVSEGGKILRWNSDDVGVFGPAERRDNLNIYSIRFFG